MKPGWLIGGTPEGPKIGDLLTVMYGFELTQRPHEINTQRVAEHTEGQQSELDIAL